MTKSKHSEFENVKFSIRNNEMVFDNFVVNGKSLGKGRATVGVVRTGLFNLVPKLTLSNMKLEDVNLESIYKEKNSQIDTFTEKINSLTAQEKSDKTTADFIKETTDKVTTLSNNTNNLINSKWKENIEKINVLKKDYVELTDLKSKAQKIVELNNEIKPLVKSINSEKENIEKNISEIELERDIALANVSDNLTKLEKEISLNDFNNNSNNNVQNMNLYIFLDKGKNLETSLNTALKATSLIKEIKDLNIRISDININDGKIVVKGLNGNNSQINGEVLLENNSKALIKGQNNGYEITYNKDNFTSKTLFAINKISSLIEYSKNDLLEGRIVKLASELILENSNFKNLNHTVLTDEEKTLLTQKIENLRNNNYQQIMSKYEEDNKNIETLIDNVYVQKNKLDKLQRDLLSLGTIITFEQSAATGENSSLSSEQNGSSAINIQNKPDSINNSDSNNTNNSTEKQNSNQNTNKINIGNR
ncbi:hybrid signal transduction histidine kinase C family protein [Leptotrichia hofstadii F0254]|uniref:Hybrid signal transduction histidine kinase C family protein n=2 Tax=Leptotrichia hofstadii TaxID=157688 RepID=C9N1R0_9FUSO|nr:hybrid signal transduction histidine kinase C family protein [Leptotrichia hofstadii F0254]